MAYIVTIIFFLGQFLENLYKNILKFMSSLDPSVWSSLEIYGLMCKS